MTVTKVLRCVLILALLATLPAHASLPGWGQAGDGPVVTHHHSAADKMTVTGAKEHGAPMSCCAGGGHCCPLMQIFLPLLTGPAPESHREAAPPPLLQPDLSRETEPPRHLPL
ncbi:MAG TPA: hypothetical protein ENJ19_03260 [Gammaproteobacteria bacterium]|nr:hypothetical protein [Gammaproteobacteria bacterium]